MLSAVPILVATVAKLVGVYIAIVALVSVRQAGLVALLACSWCW